MYGVVRLKAATSARDACGSAAFIRWDKRRVCDCVGVIGQQRLVGIHMAFGIVAPWRSGHTFAHRPAV